MKKITIIHGTPATGKSRCAKIIMECSGLFYQDADFYLIERHFCFSRLSAETNALIIDNIRDIYQLKYALEFFKKKSLEIQRQCEKQMKIKLKKIILVCDFTITKKIHFDEKYNYIHI